MAFVIGRKEIFRETLLCGLGVVWWCWGCFGASGCRWLWGLPPALPSGFLWVVCGVVVCVAFAGLLACLPLRSLASMGSLCNRTANNITKVFRRSKHCWSRLAAQRGIKKTARGPQTMIFGS